MMCRSNRYSGMAQPIDEESEKGTGVARDIQFMPTVTGDTDQQWPGESVWGRTVLQEGRLSSRANALLGQP